MKEFMAEKETSHWWWFDHHSSRRSPWLQSTLDELDKKTKAMLKLIEEDADSFAQRAEMFYRKRPELISMVEDIYRTHRSLAEQYDKLKSNSGNRLITTLGPPFSTRCNSQKLVDEVDQSYDRNSETYDPESSAESEVDDPEEENSSEVDDPEEENSSEVDDPEEEDSSELDEEMGEVEEPGKTLETRETEVPGSLSNDEVMKLQEEIGRLEKENMIQKDQLLQKDEEKREVIRQLSSAVEMLKLENVMLRKYIAKDSPKKKNLFEFDKLKALFSGKLFNVSSNSRGSLVAV